MVQPRHAGDALGYLALRRTGGAKAAEIALHIRGEHRHAGIAERLDQTLQGDRFAGTGSARHQTVSIGQAQRLANRLTGKVSTKNKLVSYRHLCHPLG
ncbi:hypothetical protein D9M68_849520 [compost metagenome]